MLDGLIEGTDVLQS